MAYFFPINKPTHKTNTINKFGFIPAIARINDKIKRAKNIVKGQDMNVKNESLRDALIDTATYCVITLIELDKQKNNEQ